MQRRACTDRALWMRLCGSEYRLTRCVRSATSQPESVSRIRLCGRTCHAVYARRPPQPFETSGVTDAQAVWLNPLDSPIGDPATAEQILDFMVTPGVPADPATVQSRYQQITREQPPLVAPPLEDRILTQLIWPLRHAKASYIVGNYLGTIALTGIV